MGASWASLCRLSGALGRLLLPLGQFWGASWALLGHSWTSLGWSATSLRCILSPGDAPGLDFEGFGDVPAWVLDNPGNSFGMPVAALRTS